MPESSRVQDLHVSLGDVVVEFSHRLSGACGTQSREDQGLMGTTRTKGLNGRHV